MKQQRQKQQPQQKRPESKINQNKQQPGKKPQEPQLPPPPRPDLLISTYRDEGKWSRSFYLLRKSPTYVQHVCLSYSREEYLKIAPSKATLVLDKIVSYFTGARLGESKNENHDYHTELELKKELVNEYLIREGPFCFVPYSLTVIGNINNAQNRKCSISIKYYEFFSNKNYWVKYRDAREKKQNDNTEYNAPHLAFTVTLPISWTGHCNVTNHHYTRRLLGEVKSGFVFPAEERKNLVSYFDGIDYFELFSNGFKLKDYGLEKILSSRAYTRFVTSQAWSWLNRCWKGTEEESKDGEYLLAVEGELQKARKDNNYEEIEAIIEKLKRDFCGINPEEAAEEEDDRSSTVTAATTTTTATTSTATTISTTTGTIRFKIK